jgi:D-glycero-D-manno-heptose 1,7-bisphosphate phosphatase
MSRFKHLIVQEPSPQAQQELPPNWPTVFPKPIVGLDRDGVINVDRGKYITDPEDFEVYPESLSAILQLRMKGYKVVILTNQGGITKGLQTHAQVDAIHQRMFELFGQAGIYTIDGLFYSESSLKNDYYAKPNLGMFHRAEKETFEGKARFKHGGFYVGDKMSDLKAADRIGATPILVRTGHGVVTEEELKKFSKEKLRKSTKVFDNLLHFVSRLP